MKKKEPAIALSKEQKAAAAAKIKGYIADNFDVNIGSLQSEIFLDFITDNIGIYYYNQAVADTQAVMSDKIEDLYLLMKDENID